MRGWRVATAAAIALAMATAGFGQSIDNLGDEFIMAFMPNYGGAWTIQLHLSSPVATDVVIEHPVNNPTFTTTVSLQPGTISIIDLPNAVPNWIEGLVMNNAVHAYSTTGDEFVCYMVNLREYTSDAAVALPVDTMHTEYIVTTHSDGFPEFVVVALYDDTTVLINPPNGAQYDVLLDHGEGFLRQPGVDATGTIVMANRPIGMTNGNQCVRYDGSQCDHIFEVAPPVQSWGLTIPVANIPETSLGVHYKIIASEDNTTISLDGTPTWTIDRGEFVYTYRLPGDHVFDADRPIFVTQFMANRSSSGGYPSGDPSLGNMIPSAQYMSDYTFSTVGGGQFIEHYLTVIAESADVGSVLLDGTPIDAGQFGAIANSNLAVARVLLDEGVHTTSSPGTHGITVEGFNLYDSYLYPGGALFQFINPHGDPWPPVCSCGEQAGPPPYFECTATDNTPSEDLNNNGLIDPGEDLNGNGIIDRDTGIFSIDVTPDSVNLLLTANYSPGDPEATYRVDLLDPGQDGWGTVVVTDGVGNTCPVDVSLTGNVAPTCVAGGPYQVECTGSTTQVPLDGTQSSDPDPNEVLTFAWTTDCPGGGFDDPASPTPVLTFDPTASCGVICGVELVLSDDGGGVSQCTADIEVIDDASPVIDAPAVGQTVACDGAGNTAQLDAWLTSFGGAQASNACGPFSWSDDYAGLSNGCGATGSATVTFTATNHCGLSADTTATFAIVDDVAPVLEAPASDMDVECDGSGNGVTLNDWLAAQGGASAFDACSDVTWSNDYAGFAGGCGATGSATVVFTATDECGLATTTAATFTINDTTPPALDTPAADMTVACDGSGNPAALAAWRASHAGAAASDACSDVTWSDDFVAISPGCGATGSALVTFTASDDCGYTVDTAATFAIIDDDAPTLQTPAGDATVECDGQGNAAELTAWLAGQGGAVATDTCSTVTWSNDFQALTAGCGATGDTTVTFTASDACDLTADTTAGFAIVDTTPPVLTCPPDATFGWGDPVGNPQLQAWLNSTTAEETCSPDAVTIVNDAPPEGFEFDTQTLVTWSATDACGNVGTCSATVIIDEPGHGDTSQKGSLLIFPHVEIRWDAAGNLIQDTFIDLSNDYPGSVAVQMYFGQGDPPVFPSGQERYHPGWNWVGDQTRLTAHEPMYWSVRTGDPEYLSPFTVLDPSSDPLTQGRPAGDGSGDRLMRGFVLAWAIDNNGDEICWNHLTGKALVVNYAQSGAWEYNAFAFRCRSVEHGLPCADPGVLHLDGTEYDFCPDFMLLDFYAVGSTGLNTGTHTIDVDTDVCLLPGRIDLRQDSLRPLTTKAYFDIWNQNEVRFSGTERCITCWDQTLLSAYEDPNHFLVAHLQTNKGRARIDGLASPVCDTYNQPGQPDVISELTPLLAVTFRRMVFTPGGDRDSAGTALGGAGIEMGLIQYDPVPPPPEVNGDGGDTVPPTPEGIPRPPDR